MASNELIGGLLQNMVMEKAALDLQKKNEMRSQNAKSNARKGNDDDEDFDDDEEALKIMSKMKQDRLSEVEGAAKKTQKVEKVMFPGEYREISEDEFLPYVTKNTFAVCHFYHRDFERCKILDSHLRKIAQDHQEAKFLTLNAEKAPFFVQKLAIQVLPTICCFKDGILIDKIVGFSFTEKDDFKTIELTRQLVKCKVIKPKTEAEKGFKLNKVSKKNNEDSGSDCD